MKNYTKVTILSILSLFFGNQLLSYPCFYKPCYYREVPAVIVHREPVYVHHYVDSSAAEAVGCAVGLAAVGLGCGLAAIIGNNSVKKQMRQHVEMFEDLGYDHAQARVYAKMAMETDGGFEEVVRNIEREKEMSRKLDAQRQQQQREIDGTVQLEQLKHQQGLEKMTYEHQLGFFNNKSMLVFIALFGVIIVLLLVVIVWLYRRQK